MTDVSRTIEVDELLRFEAGMRRRRGVMVGVVIALGAGALGVFAYSAYSARTSMEQRGVQVVDLASLPAEERAEIERATGIIAAEPVTCPGGMIGIPRFAQTAAFCVDARDATNAEVAACIAAGDCATPQPGIDCVPVDRAPPDEPATCIDFHTMSAYCRAHGRRDLDFEEFDRAVHLLHEDVNVRCVVSPR